MKMTVKLTHSIGTMQEINTIPEEKTEAVMPEKKVDWLALAEVCQVK